MNPTTKTTTTTRTTRRLLKWIALSLAVSHLAACRKPIPDRHNVYGGPTDPLVKVVADVNANNASITSLWSDHSFKAWIHDDRKKEHYVDGDGVLLYRKTPLGQGPDELLIKGSAIIGDVFEIGSTTGDDAQYWVAVVPEVGTEWWGFYRNLGKPCVQSVPIHPDLVTEVLGVADVNTNLLDPPFPTMRYNNDEDVYMLTWNVPFPNRWVVQKEVWFDRATKLPRLVNLFDPDGRVVLRAYLSDHQPVDGADGKKVATRYNLLFPESKDQLQFTLKNPKLTKRGIPKPGTIQRRPIGDVRTVQIDENCK